MMLVHIKAKTESLTNSPVCRATRAIQATARNAIDMMAWLTADMLMPAYHRHLDEVRKASKKLNAPMKSVTTPTNTFSGGPRGVATAVRRGRPSGNHPTTAR